MQNMLRHAGITIVAVSIFIAPLLHAQPPEAANELDRQLLEDLNSLDEDPQSTPSPRPGAPAGEDIGSSAEHPIAEIVQQMEASRQRLERGDTSAETVQLQRQIADDLARLIEQLRRQQSSASAGQTASAAPSPSQTRGAGDDSQEGTQRTEVPPPDAPIGHDVWGHLPQRVREQLDSAGIDEFLPSFEEMIEAYYRRLAAENDVTPRQN